MEYIKKMMKILIAYLSDPIYDPVENSILINLKRSHFFSQIKFKVLTTIYWNTAKNGSKWQEN